MCHAARFQFFATLNDFLSPIYKNKPVYYNFNGAPAVKDAIEAIGIPHTEVDVIIANNLPVNFFYKLHNNDKVAVFPVDFDTAFSKRHSLIPNFDYPLAFVADVHLGKLAKLLRINGFDTNYQNDFTDKAVAEIAEKEPRIVLTRDVGLLKYKSIKWGYWLRSQQAEKQLEEVFNRYNLFSKISCFKRCILCNGEIEEVPKETVLKQIPPKTALFFNEFFQCSSCKRVYWKGSHYENMLKRLNKK